ncbi:uncharacterized protein TNCV_1834551 [Trichonephila clavipes]|nr:uncharacterized protein TNCV_1834551 [Trichonephila clavipes]
MLLTSGQKAIVTILQYLKRMYLVYLRRLRREAAKRRVQWSTTAELSNRHSSCRAVSNSIRVAGGGKREDTARPRASQRFSMGLRSGEYAGYAIRVIPSLSR